MNSDPVHNALISVIEIRNRAFREVLTLVNEIQPDDPLTDNLVRFGHRRAREQIYTAVEALIREPKELP